MKIKSLTDAIKQFRDNIEDSDYANLGGKGKYFDKETTQTANYILAGPTAGSAAAAAYRAGSTP